MERIVLMMQWFKDMLSSENNKSSARVINFIGAVTGTLLLTYETYLHGLHVVVFGVYLAYCGGVYVSGKYLDKKEGVVDETTIG